MVASNSQRNMATVTDVTSTSRNGWNDSAQKAPPFRDISNKIGNSSESADKALRMNHTRLNRGLSSCKIDSTQGICVVLFETNLDRLRNILTLSWDGDVDAEIQEDRILQLAILFRSLAQLLSSFMDALFQHIVEFADDLSSVVRKAVKHAMDCGGDTSPQFAVLASSVRIIRCAAPLCGEHLPDFVRTLTMLLSYNIPCDVRVDAACTITGFLELDQASVTAQCEVERCASLIISVLSTAALTNNLDTANDTLHALLVLSKDPILSEKLRCRRGVAVALLKTTARAEGLALLALEIISYLLKNDCSCPSEMIVKNLSMLVDHLGSSLLNKETSPTTQSVVITTLKDSFGVPAVQRSTKMAILGTLFQVVQAEGVSSTEALDGFLFGVSKLNTYDHFLGQLSELCVSSLSVIRRKVLRELDNAFLWYSKGLTASAKFPDLLDVLCILISNGSPEDCTDSSLLCRRIVAEPSGKKCMLDHKLLISSLVSFLSGKEIRNRPAFINVVEVILDLQMSDEGLRVFLLCIDVLPFMIELANKTTNDDLKERLVDRILRLTRARLEDQDGSLSGNSAL